MSILRSVLRRRMRAFFDRGAALDREAEAAGLQRALLRSERVDTPAGEMLVTARGDAGPAGAVELDFMRRDGDEWVANSGGQIGPGDARATVAAIERALASMLADQNPAALTYHPTTGSRDRLYRALMARRGAGYRPDDEGARPGYRRWARELSPEEEAARQRHAQLRAEADRAYQAGRFWDNTSAVIAPLDAALTYGAPAAAGGAGLLALLRQREQER